VDKDAMEFLQRRRISVSRESLESCAVVHCYERRNFFWRRDVSSTSKYLTLKGGAKELAAPYAKEDSKDPDSLFKRRKFIVDAKNDSFILMLNGLPKRLKPRTPSSNARFRIVFIRKCVGA
jgi:hypothetical protein